MPEIILLDTLIWFWWINEEHHRFPASWLVRIENAEKVLVSPVSCFEIALANQGGRLTLPCNADDWLHDALTPAGVELLPMTAAIVTRAVSLSPIHKDPSIELLLLVRLNITRNFPQY